MFKYDYDATLGIASIASTWDGITVHTLPQQPGSKRAAATAFMGARYSRSRDSIVDIMKEVSEKGIDPVKRLEAIFHGYGHASVGDLCTITVAIENVPMFVAERFFSLCPVHFAQARSTRYQDYSNPAWIKMSDVGTIPRELCEQHDALMFSQFRAYRELGELTTQAFHQQFAPDAASLSAQTRGALNARIFDTTRYLLQLGVSTSFAALMTARGWSEYIGLMLGSDQVVERAVGILLFQLLTGTPEHLALGYVPEADGLIRHTEPNSTQSETAIELMALCQQQNSFINQSTCPDVQVLPQLSPEAALYQHIKLLDDATVNPRWCPAPSRQFEQQMGEVIFTRHNNYRQMGVLGQSGAICIHGRMDVGAWRDMMRHRSLRRVVPFYHSQFNLLPDLQADPNHELCPYLDLAGFHHLKKLYAAHFETLYAQIKPFYAALSQAVAPVTALEFTRYLLPHAHRLTYRVYGDIDSLQYAINLRHRPGGHIRYRQLVYQWLEALAVQSPFWRPLLTKLKQPDPASLEEFFNRS